MSDMKHQAKRGLLSNKHNTDNNNDNDTDNNNNDTKCTTVTIYNSSNNQSCLSVNKGQARVLPSEADLLTNAWPSPTIWF